MKNPHSANSITAFELESRILYSASPLPVEGDLAMDADPTMAEANEYSLEQADAAGSFFMAATDIQGDPDQHADQKEDLLVSDNFASSAISPDPQLSETIEFAVGSSQGIPAGDTVGAVTHTVTGEDRFILVSVVIAEDSNMPNGQAVQSITFAGVELTSVGVEDGPGANSSRLEIFALVAPELGTHDVEVTLSDPNHDGAVFSVISFTGVDQNDPVGFSSNSSASDDFATVGVNSEDGNLVFSLVGSVSFDNLDFEPGDDQTEVFDAMEGQINAAASLQSADDFVLATYEIDDIENSFSILGLSINATPTPTSTPSPISDPIDATASEDDPDFSIDLSENINPNSNSAFDVDNLTLISGDDRGITLVGDLLQVSPDAYNDLGVGESEVIEFQYNIVSPNGQTQTASAVITIIGANDAPTVSGEIERTLQITDDPLTIDLLEGAVDPDGDPLTITSINVSGGGVRLSGTEIVVDPSAYQSLGIGETELIVVEYRIGDGNGGFVNQTASITITNTANRAPTVSGTLVGTGNENQLPSSASLLLGASDPDGDTLNVESIFLLSGDDRGISFAGNEVFFTPGDYAFLTDGEVEIIEYRIVISDGNGGRVDQFLTVEIEGINDGPVVADSQFQIAPGGSPVIGNLLDGAFDEENDSLSILNSSAAPQGTLDIGADGSFTFTPDTPFFDSFEITFTATDGSNISNLGTVTFVGLGNSNLPLPGPTPAPTIVPPAPVDTDQPAETDSATESTPEPSVAPVAPAPIAQPTATPNTPPASTPELPTVEQTSQTTPSPIIQQSNEPDLNLVQNGDPGNAIYQSIDVNLGLQNSIELQRFVSPPGLSATFLSSLDRFGEEVDEFQSTFEFEQFATIASLSGVSVGVVTWVIRSGAILASVVANLPAWRLVDPLLVLGYSRDGVQDDESILDIVENEQTVTSTSNS